MPRRTFLDSNVLIAAHRGQTTQREAALRILADRDRAFVSTPFLELELLPKAICNGYAAEAEFYIAYFNSVELWIGDVDATVQVAREESERLGLSAMDALLVAAASLGEAEEFYTLESARKPIYRTALVRVIPLLPQADAPR